MTYVPKHVVATDPGPGDMVLHPISTIHTLDIFKPDIIHFHLCSLPSLANTSFRGVLSSPRDGRSLHIIPSLSSSAGFVFFWDAKCSFLPACTNHIHPYPSLHDQRSALRQKGPRQHVAAPLQLPRRVRCFRRSILSRTATHWHTIVGDVLNSQYLGSPRLGAANVRACIADGSSWMAGSSRVRNPVGGRACGYRSVVALRPWRELVELSGKTIPVALEDQDRMIGTIYYPHFKPW
jgi:hypothetical protein